MSLRALAPWVLITAPARSALVNAVLMFMGTQATYQIRAIAATTLRTGITPLIATTLNYFWSRFQVVPPGLGRNHATLRRLAPLARPVWPIGCALPQS